MKSILFKSAIAAAMGMISTHSFAAYVAITNSGSPVLKECQGVQEPSPDPTPPAAGTCQVTGLPGTGYTQIRNANGNIVAAGTVVGTYNDRVWQQNGTNNYVFGIRLSMNTTTYTPPAGCADRTPTYFEINDILRSGFGSYSNLTVAYKQPGSAEEGLWLAGRTAQGVNEYAASPYGLDPTRNNDWVDFRTDVNANDPDGTSKAASAWLLVTATVPGGVSASQVANAIRLWQGGEEGQCKFSVYLPGFKPN
jgi:hypothetical protein